ncbi:MAG: sulfatase-like hydrolase/transferase [Verrucomicrobiota bacterium]
MCERTTQAALLLGTALGLLMISVDRLPAAQPTVLSQSKPNILWIITDDHRYDSIRAFNEAITGEEMSPLGYVESPNTDRLAEMGTTFINTYCQAQGCAPSRASMHYGRYPHRSGLYEFEWFNDQVEHAELSVPEQMALLGYQTFHVGKMGVRVRTTHPNGRFGGKQKYEQSVFHHPLWLDGLTDWRNTGTISEVDGVKVPNPGRGEWFMTPEGDWEVTASFLNEVPGLEDHNRTIDEKYDILRKYKSPKDHAYGSGEIIGGVSPLPCGETRDGVYNQQLIRFLENQDKKMKIGSQSFTGVDPSRPLMAYIGYDFPHTPVLPPKSFRDRFANKRYEIPEVDPDEFDKLPPQLQKLVRGSASDHYSEEDKQQMVQDYYAFCAYGDALIGEAVDAFIEYSESQRQEWMILYVCGDHGWRLNEHGAIYKFAPWKTDALTPVIVVSSDKETFPAGKVVTELTELVDLAPTIIAAGGGNLDSPEFEYLDGFDLAKVVSGDIRRDYVIKESHAVTGPRATIRTQDYMFSIKSRPRNRMGGENMNWAMNATYKQLEPVLYDLQRDPEELNNVAFDSRYRRIAEAMREKLLDIVIGDGRVEVDWKQDGSGTEIVRSNFAPGADDKELSL